MREEMIQRMEAILRAIEEAAKLSEAGIEGEDARTIVHSLNNAGQNISLVRDYFENIFEE